MKTFQQFMEDIDPKANPLNQANYNAEYRQRRQKVKQRKMAQKHTTTNQEEYDPIMTEVYDKDVMDRSQIRQTGEGGRKEPKRDTASRRRPGVKPRVKAVGGGKTVPVGEYKDRKDIGATKARSEREQQPTQERGSKEVKQSYADKVKAERRAAAQARIAAKKGGAPAPEKKKTPTASELLAKKKKKEVASTYKPGTGKPQKDYTRKERQQLIRKGESEVIKMMKDTESKKQGIPASKVKLQKFKRTYG